MVAVATLVPLRVQRPVAARVPLRVLRRVPHPGTARPRPLEVRVYVEDADVDPLADDDALQRRYRLLARAHHHGALAEGRLGVLCRAVGIVRSDADRESEGPRRKLRALVASR